MVENKYYERKIKYLDLMENGERTSGAGFIKMEVKGMDINLTIAVKGLHPTDTYEREVMLQAGDGEFAVGRIALKGGQGEFKYHTVMDHSQLQGIRIALGGVREICCKWQEEKRISTVQAAAGQRDAARVNGRQGHEISGNVDESMEMERQISAKKQNSTKKPKEIQLIPWDEIKAVEESLERVDKMMSNPEVGNTWEAAEKGAARNGEREPAGEKDEMGSIERETAAERIVPGSTDRKPAEGTAGRSRTEQKAAVERMDTERGVEDTVIRGSMSEEPTTHGQGAGEASAQGKMVEESIFRKSGTRGIGTDETVTGNRTVKQWGTGENPTMTGGRNRNMENRTSNRNPERRTERPTRRTSSGNSLEQKKRPVRLMEDKWQQIWAIYPHIRPFQDEREYLSISPADFVLLPGEAYRAANNSFLLHGYYNYDHLILTRIEKRGEVSYYIGVPGNYYEREKQVAIMFGFESFECGTEPAQAGDFGYYMMRTQL